MALRRLALFSCSNKTNIKPLARYFLNRDFDIVSTGGTYSVLKQYVETEETTYVNNVHDVQSHTQFPEILGGRVKTLHPNIHAGILAVRDDPDHMNDMKQHNIPLVDVVVSNLYPFSEVRREYNESILRNQLTQGSNAETNGTSFQDVIENIDIGGVALTRAAAKNHKFVTVITDPKQYPDVMERFDQFTSADRLHLAVEAFRLTSSYDEEIFDWMELMYSAGKYITPKKKSKTTPNLHRKGSYHLQKRGYHTKRATPSDINRGYSPRFALKYGSNPHQRLTNRTGDTGANVYSIDDRVFPFSVLNGGVSYINMLDALNSWQLVRELSDTFNAPAAASFKHTSPAGAAVYVADNDLDTYPCDGDETLIAYKKARGADPMCSFGDFIAISGTVGLELARYIRKQISDGIIAESYTPEALEVLSKKKKGKYVVLQGSVNNDIPDVEFREMYGVAISQPVNIETIDWDDLSKDNIVTQRKELTSQERSDLMLANISLKYAQSNNVALAYEGQLIGISAGQQSRIHSVRLASHKAKVWMLRNDYAVDTLFEECIPSRVKHQDKVNLKMRLIEHCLGETLTDPETDMFCKNIGIDCVFLETLEEIVDGYNFNDSNVSLASDAFFPFRDNIDCMSTVGVSAIAQPGGSVRDEPVIDACNEYGMAMVCHNKRMFTH